MNKRQTNFIFIALYGFLFGLLFHFLKFIFIDLFGKRLSDVEEGQKKWRDSTAGATALCRRWKLRVFTQSNNDIWDSMRGMQPNTVDVLLALVQNPLVDELNTFSCKQRK